MFVTFRWGGVVCVPEPCLHSAGVILIVLRDY